MRERILKWLFGTYDIDDYLDLLVKSRDHTKEEMRLIDDHLKTLDRAKEYIDTILKLIKICDIHGIDVDTEIKNIKVDDEGNAYEVVG